MAAVFSQTDSPGAAMSRGGHVLAEGSLVSGDMFIKIEGIDGESKDDAHEDEIDVLSWTFGMTQPGTFHVGGGGGAGKVQVQDLSFIHQVDLATPVLMLKCSNGDHIPEAVLTVRKAGKDPLEYIIITMKKVMVTSISTAGGSTDGRLFENVTLNFAEISYKYAQQSDEGGEEASKTYEWNIEANKGDVS